jgi:pilus assembly protein CpaB
MSARKIVLVILALAITAGTAVFVRNWVSNQQPQVVEKVIEEKTGPLVLVAKADIPKGVFLQPTHLRWSQWPDKVIPENYYTDDLFTIEDMGFLAAVLRPGYRAMALRIDATSSIGGLAFPGDRVDLILTHNINGQQVSETVLENVRILGIDQFIDESDGKPRVGKNATLEITPKQAEMLAVVTALGTINLSLRSLVKDEEELNRLANLEDPLEEPDPERGKTFTFASEVSNVLSPPPSTQPAPQVERAPAPRSKTVNVTRGSESSVLKF